MSVVDDLKVAKAEMATRGRCAHKWMDDDGRVCLVGALGAAVGINLETADYSDFCLNERAKAAGDLLTAYIGQEDVGHSNFGLLTHFNDRSTTTDQDIMNLFDKAIADLGGML